LVKVQLPPKPACLAVDAHRDFIEVPDITAGRWLSANAPGIVGAMFSAPPADCLIGYSDPSFEQHFFNMAQAQRKPIIEPDGAGDDLWREPVVLVIGDGLVHAQPSIDNLLSQKQCDIAPVACTRCCDLVVSAHSIEKRRATHVVTLASGGNQIAVICGASLLRFGILGAVAA
jgi:hypothetical protein